MEDTKNLSIKLKAFLEKRLRESHKKIKKLKRRRLMLKVFVITTGCISITISVIIAGTATLVLGPAILATLTVIAGTLTGISINFNIKTKKTKLDKELHTETLLNNKLDYVISCNGDLTRDNYTSIINEVLNL